MMTEENLDDWIAQSINRSLASMVNPQKKFHLPVKSIRLRLHTKMKSKQDIAKKYPPKNIKIKLISKFSLNFVKE